MIETFLYHSKGIPSPTIFRLWAAISTVAGALERRVWVVSAGTPIYPSLYILLVGGPGSGKTIAVNIAERIWRALKVLKVAPNSVSRASLTDVLSRAKRTMILSETKIHESHSLQIAAAEFGVLVPTHDMEFLNFLNDIYDNRETFGEEKRGGGLKLDIINPQINLIAGTQPVYLATLLPEEAWGMGFMTRINMIYSAEKVRPRLFASNDGDVLDLTELTEQIKPLLNIYGKAEWDEDAKIAIQGWWDLDGPPVPEHSRLAHYNTRRILHVMRLCIVSAASAGHPLRITHSDYVRATDWLIEAERTIPDIFKEMVNKSDAQVIKELHYFIWKYQVQERKPQHEARLMYFLQTRAPAERISRILEVAVRAGIFEKILTNSGTFYKARPIGDHGVE